MEWAGESMEEYAWGFQLTAKGGQDVKENEKKGIIQVKNKEKEHTLKVKIKSAGESVDEVLKEIVEEVGGLDEVTFTISGQEPQLQAYTKKIAKIISEHGDQKTLDIHFGKEQLEA